MTHIQWRVHARYNVDDHKTPVGSLIKMALGVRISADSKMAPDRSHLGRRDWRVNTYYPGDNRKANRTGLRKWVRDEAALLLDRVDCVQCGDLPQIYLDEHPGQTGVERMAVEQHHKRRYPRMAQLDRQD